MPSESQQSASKLEHLNVLEKISTNPKHIDSKQLYTILCNKQ